jgi:DNA-binding beta-propeller fold protein YncE
MHVPRMLFVLCLAGAITLQAGTGYKVVDRYHIGGVGGWDYISIDSSARRLYVSHATQVDVLDADTGTSVGVIGDTPGVHGIAIALGMNRGFTSNGRENKVSMFDTQTLKLIEKIDVGKGPDGIYYDEDTKRVFTNNHGTHDISAIDAASGKVVGTINIGGDGEQAVKGADGMFYVNLEDKDEVASFNPKTLELGKRFPIGVGKTPTGLAYDRKYNRLFIGCRSKSLVVMDAASGRVITSLPIGQGVDFAGFDPDARLIFESNGDGTLGIFRQKSADEYEDAGAVITQPTARTMALDTKTKKVFLPAAEPDPAKARTMKENSFVILVVGK